jgi:hypothetical protein
MLRGLEWQGWHKPPYWNIQPPGGLCCELPHMLVIRSLLSVRGSSVSRPTKYRASGAQAQLCIGKG